MPSSPEMSVFRLRLNQELLDCASCARIIQPDKYNYKAHACPLCSRGQFYCGICMSDHSCLQVPLVHVSYSLLNDIIAHMKFKCNCKKYFPYCEFQDHWRKCQSAKYFTNRGPACVWKCTLETSFLECSKCKGLIQPPVFLLQFRDRLICSACYRPDVGTYRHCTEVEDLLQGIMVKCVACKQYLPFSTLGPHQLCDCPESKLQNIAVGLSARIKFYAQAPPKQPLQLFVPHRPVTRSRKRVLLTDGSTIDK
ncbi:hypothetical protein BS78_K121300 [Paspalum vaginatum]|uniref:Uncharacterized protein n=1 Tax=Paspalum vaginatum TaxID=158149 RepID=A0A9W8CEN2_9POAL|nr:hypothetical protein BS78_K121300 [Paspalum vaginatum]